MSRTDKSHRDRKQISGGQGKEGRRTGGEAWGVTANGYIGFLLGAIKISLN